MPDPSPAGRDQERRYYALNRRVYAVLAPFYDAIALPLRRLRHEIAAALEAGPQTRILDVATGTGSQALAFARSAGQVVGIDISEAMLKIARRKNGFSNLTFEKADAASLPFRDASFDAVCVSFALHEMPASIRERVLAEMLRVTKPGGSIIAVDYALPRNRVVRTLALHIVKLYERENYPSLVHTGLPELLAGAGIEVRERRLALGGLVAAVMGRRPEAAVSGRTAAAEPAIHAG